MSARETAGEMNVRAIIARPIAGRAWLFINVLFGNLIE
jgi:hypothetical protein